MPVAYVRLGNWSGCAGISWVAIASGRQAGAAFRAALLDDAAAGFGCHACTEAVGAGSLDVAGLERAFHVSVLAAGPAFDLSFGRNLPPRFQRAGKDSVAPGESQ